MGVNAHGAGGEGGMPGWLSECDVSIHFTYSVLDSKRTSVELYENSPV